MVKFFEWSSAGTVDILPAPSQNKRYRILACPMTCNEETGIAVLHEGAEVPSNGSANVIDFVDSVRLNNGNLLAGPYMTQPKLPINLTTTDSGGTTSGRGLVIYIEEAY